MIITIPPTGDPAIDTPALADAIQQLHAAGGGGGGGGRVVVRKLGHAAADFEL